MQWHQLLDICIRILSNYPVGLVFSSLSTPGRFWFIQRYQLLDICIHILGINPVGLVFRSPCRR